MKYELNNQIYSINDELSINVLVVGFATKILANQILKNLEDLEQVVPLLKTKLYKDDNKYYFFEMENSFDYKIEECDNVNTWIANQVKTPLDIFNGEFFRIALNNENKLIIIAHNIFSDSRGLINFSKALLIGKDKFNFTYNEDLNSKLNIINKITANNFKKLEKEADIKLETSKLKVKRINIKSKIVYSLCSSYGVSTLAFFIAIALSLNKAKRKTIKIPFCIKESDNNLLVNDSYNIKFKRGLEPRLSFYDNAGEIDKLFKSFLKRKPYLKRYEILKNVPTNLKADPLKNSKYLNYIKSELYFDVLPSIDEDEVIRTLQFYPSSSFVSNGFGISIVDDKISISSIIHDEEGEKFFNDFQKTINLISKNSDLVLK